MGVYDPGYYQGDATQGVKLIYSTYPEINIGIDRAAFTMVVEHETLYIAGFDQPISGRAVLSMDFNKRSQHDKQA